MKDSFEITLVDRVAASASDSPLMHLTGCTGEERLMIATAERILAMPEMQAIKTTLKEVFIDAFHDKDQIIGGMKAWGYSDELCDWVLS